MSLNLLLAGLILWVGVTIFRTWASARNLNAGSAVRITSEDFGKSSQEKKTERIQYFRSIIAPDIFKTKKSVEKPVLKKEFPALLKVTDLNLELKGTMMGERGERLAVILDGKTREQDIYHVNDFIHGVRIDKILSGKVILNRNGKEESLQMSYESGPAQIPRVPERIRPRRSTVRIPPRKKTLPTRILPRTRKLPEAQGSEDVS